MDIENMHPFCLPFGLCHDATSSEFGASHINNNNNSLNNNNNPNDNLKDKSASNRSKTSSPSDELFRHLSDACSSTERLLLATDDCPMIGDHTSPLHDDDIFYSALKLDLDNIGSSCDENRTEFDIGFNSNGDKVDDIDIEDDDLHKNDWFSPSQYSLFSPNGLSSGVSGSIKKRRKSLLSRIQNQVFQHVVDPIDIKSSPTLAQLNLNSTDDPTDGLWDTTTTSISTTTTATSAATTTNESSASVATATAHANVDLLTNSTSILDRTLHPNGVIGNSLCPANSIGGNSVTCNHLNHNHTHHSSLSSFGHHHSSLCHHVQHHHHYHPNHHHHHHNRSLFNQTTQSTCLAVTPYRKHLPSSTDPLYSASGLSASPCCHHHGHNSANQPASIGNFCSGANLLSQQQNGFTCGTANGAQNLKPSSTLNQLNQQHCQQATLDETSKQKASTPNNLSHLQRSASPALVTSSSSPLSTGANPASNHAGSGGEAQRGTDNKLKENIEYLTALLCNGNTKLQESNSQQQQISHQQYNNNTRQPAPISSTMMRSYATLAHSLSTGPKLLERSSTSAFSNEGAPMVQHQKPTGHDLNGNACPSNEATSFVEQSNAMSLNNPAMGLKRPYAMNGPNLQQPQQQQQWFKAPVESSVSAADSTDNQVSSLANQGSLNQHHHQQHYHQVPSYPHQANGPQLVDKQQRRSSELKVLSSLLSSNKGHAGPQPTPGVPNFNQPTFAASACHGWPTQERSDCNHHYKMVDQQQELSSNKSSQTTTVTEVGQMEKQSETSIPPNGKPITLTPLSSSNGLIIQPPEHLPKSRPSVFAQPASPSTSSTASSGGNTIESSPSSSTTTTTITTTSVASGLQPAIKKQRTSQSSISQQADSRQRAASSNRSARPNSMSTDCSLSSHDEGFSSQVDNDDCGSNRESDDEEDDVDSDDESFYGDYTNSDLIGASISDNAENKWTLNMGRTRRNGQKRYFWQYNVQSKGPKGTRISSTDNPDDPFVLPEASDPVFSNDCQVEGVKHSGKARRGDGNDLTPNPRKLLMIGLELKKLGKIINDLAPVTDLPLNARNKTRKEKNKLASRACRLKKKAQHEANKIKLYGLQREHQQCVSAIYDARKLLNEALKLKTQQTSGATSESGLTSQQPSELVSPKVVSISERCSMKVAGETSDYVNSVLEKVVSGCIDGGLQT